VKTYKEAEATTPEQLQGMTPPQVDELLGAVDSMMDLAYHRRYVAEERIETQATGDRYRNRAYLPFREALDKVTAQAKESPQGPAAVLLRDYEDALAMIGKVAKVEDKFETEWQRRGRWTRSFLVTDGHAHKTNRCTTCHRGGKRTSMHRFWRLSGMDETEIVDLIKDRACTVCYPSAPVAKGLKVGESTLLTPEEEKRVEQREAERVKREEKKAKAAAGAITLPDGTPLREKVGRDGKQAGSIIKTLRTARSDLKRQCCYQYAWGDDDGGHERLIQHLARAVAWKERGLAIGEEPTDDEIQAVIEPLRKAAIKEVDKARREQR
jgi:cytochrome c553